MSKLSTKIAIMLFAFCSLLCAGCVEGDVRMFFKYEPKDDSFRYMEVYTNIQTTKKEDLDSLQSLWEHRRSIIINPVDLHLFGRNAFEREGKHTYRTVSLGGYSPRRDPAKKEPEAKGTPEIKFTSIDLDTIQVIPAT
jgi:hypothetical protein